MLGGAGWAAKTTMTAHSRPRNAPRRAAPRCGGAEGDGVHPRRPRPRRRWGEGATAHTQYPKLDSSRALDFFFGACVLTRKEAVVCLRHEIRGSREPSQLTELRARCRPGADWAEAGSEGETSHQILVHQQFKNSCTVHSPIFSKILVNLR